MNIDLIPCELCSQQFPPDQYIIHITTHSPNDVIPNKPNNNVSNHCSNTNTNNTNTNPSNNNNNFLCNSDTIPCDTCSQQIPLNEYESHLLMHSLSSSNNNNNNNNNTIPCSNPNCNQQIPFNQYETHQLQHLHHSNNNNNHNHNNSNNLMIECEFSDCKTKWIPKNEYLDHVTLHRLQSQQQPNTSNDALIAFNHQSQLIQQQTATVNTIPDPRRICLSNAFMHLQSTQKPVIPIHDTLILNETNTNTMTNNAVHVPRRDNHYVSAIIESIDHVLSSRSHLQYYLCDPLLFYYRDREDYSWGCGFRNCQTLTSSLNNRNNIYCNYLFNGIGYVPMIEQIQRYLDYAHVQGFDPEGLKELGLTQGRRVWIGAVDVAAVLRSFYIPAAIFDFQLAPQETYHNDLFQWVWDYFVQRYKYHQITASPNSRNRQNENQTLISSYFQSANSNVEDGDVGMKKKENNNKMEMSDDSDSGSSFSGNEADEKEKEKEKKSDDNDNDLCYWEKDDVGDLCKKPKKAKIPTAEISINKNDKNRFIPPLYFQHQGHSRTIIGIIYNKKSKIRHLLVLDPSVKKGGINLLNNIKNGNIQQLLRSKKQIKAAKYQIVAIPTYGIMTNNDRNRCKTIQSMDVTLMNKNSKN